MRELSIIVPALNEEKTIGPLVDEVKTAIIDQGISAELILVDDGSTDGTLERMQDAAILHDWVVPLHRTRPQGQSAALHAGIAVATGKYIATLDADLQNDPADLPVLLKRVQSGDVEMAQGMRVKRKDHLLRKFSSWVGRTARKLILGDEIRDTGCSTRVLRIEIARQLPLNFTGMHRFIPVYARMIGARIAEAPVNHRPRAAGVAKYGMLNRGLVGLFDCFAMRWMLRRFRDASAERVVVKPVLRSWGDDSSDSGFLRKAS